MSNNIQEFTIREQFIFLSHALRFQLEQNIKYPALFEKDQDEARYNLEIAVKAVFDAFHRVYDIVYTVSKKQINFYDRPALHLILSIRNAIHHNKKIKNIFNVNDDFFYVDFEPVEPSLPCISFPISWGDIQNYILSEKHGREKLPQARCFLQADDFEKEALNNNFEIEQIYINIIPIMLRAGKALVELCELYIPSELDSCEGDFFYGHFKDIKDDDIFKSFFPYNQDKYIDNINRINAFTDWVANNYLPQLNSYIHDI